MKAVCWCGSGKVQIEDVPVPRVLNPRDAIVKTRLTTICGSDLHLYGGFVPSMMKGDILGHEIVGDIVEVGSEVRKVKVGDRVVVGSVIACGNCWYCKCQEYSLCDNSNPNAWMMEKMYNFSTAGIFGYSHMFGGYAGAQAEYLRVPFADVGSFVVPESMTDEQALCCSDIFPTGFMGAELCDIKPGDTVAVWGCGPIGQMVIKSAFLLGAENVIAIENVRERLYLAAEKCGAIPVNHDQVDIYDELKRLTGNRGPDACVDAVGMEAHGFSWFMSAYDKVKTAMFLESDRGHVIRAMVQACRKGGTCVIMGAYGMLLDKFPLGAAFNKGLKLRMGQQHGQRYIPRLFDYCTKGQIDPSFVFTHHMPLSEAPQAYEIFRKKKQHCVKVALRPAGYQVGVQQSAAACEPMASVGAGV